MCAMSSASSGMPMDNARFTYARIMIENTAATLVSFRGIERVCYAAYHTEEWTCSCKDGIEDPTRLGKCTHLLWLESGGWQKLLRWCHRPKTAVILGEILD